MHIKQALPTIAKDSCSDLRERAQERPTNQARRERTKSCYGISGPGEGGRHQGGTISAGHGR
ncbi:hypothetical protein GCM10009646_44950 [Streptomyces aureus]